MLFFADISIRMFMLFFADVSIFAQPPFNMYRAGLRDIRTLISA